MGKRAFTLLEVLISISLVSMIALFLGIKSFQAIKYYTHKSNVEKLSHVIHSCQKIASIENRDYLLILSNTPEGITYEVVEPSKNPKKIKRTLKNLSYKVGGHTGPFHLGFASTGKCYPSASIELLSFDEVFKKIIDLDKETNVSNEKKSQNQPPFHPNEVS